MKIKGFTIVPDYIVQKYTAIGGLIYGKIVRYCEWSELNMCTASNKRLADELNVGESTIRKYKKIFADDKLLIVVGKHGETDTVTIPEEMVVEMHPPLLDSEPLATKQRTTPLLDSNKDTIKDTKKDIKNSIERGQKLGATIQADFRNWLGLTPNWDTKTNQGNYQFFRERYQAGETAQKFKEWWVASDWRGKQGQQPTFNQVREMWGQAFIANVEQTQYRKAD